jgi:6-phosphofructokinase 1
LFQVPKSIDNDVMLVDKTFGFDTVVQEVVTRPLLAAKVEAASARKGVGLVKVCSQVNCIQPS